MLVARFPEFERHPSGRLTLKLPQSLWSDKTALAKDLIQRLMCYEPESRITAYEALHHEWLGEFRWSDIEVAGPDNYSHSDQGNISNNTSIETVDRNIPEENKNNRVLSSTSSFSTKSTPISFSQPIPTLSQNEPLITPNSTTVSLRQGNISPIN